MPARTHDLPNLFDYATSELSQDAFICWILSWADPKHEKSPSAALNKCGQAFIRAFFEKHNKKPPETIKSVKITRQDKHIDVLCIVNNDYYIIIEDKTSTSPHSNQLARYIETIVGREVKRGNVLPIYFKTYDQSNYDNERENEYGEFTRKDILETIKPYVAPPEGQAPNAILYDYYDRLKRIDEEVKQYAELKSTDDWSLGAWTGLFMRLQKELEDGNWSYVPNPTGGFMGFWWHYCNIENYRLHLILKYTKLCFNIEFHDHDQSKQQELRWEWCNRIIQAAQLPGDYRLEIKKPKKFGTGKYVTIAELVGDFRQFDNDGKLNINATRSLLKNAESILDAAITANPKSTLAE